MQTVLLEGPREEPLSVEEVKEHLRITGHQEDGLLGLYIQMNRSSLEEYIQKSFLTQLWKVSFSPSDIESVQARRDAFYRLPYGPVQKILSLEERMAFQREVKTLPLNQGEFTSPDKMTFKGRLSTGSGLEITYAAGLSETKEKLPSSLRYALLLSVAQLYEQRSWEGAKKEDTRIKNLLAPYKSWRL